MSNHSQSNPNVINYLYVGLLASVAALGGLLFGYDTAVISGGIGFLTDYFQLSEIMEGWVASCALIGCMIGAAMAGWLSDRFGRKTVLKLSAILFLVSAVGSAVPRTLSEFIVARVVGGVGVGIASMLSPLYIAEVAPAKIRGGLVTLNQLAIVFGMLVVYFVNSQIAAAGDEAWNLAYGWRWMFGSETLPALLFFGLLFWVPESPRWLTQQGREGEAAKILTDITGESQANAQMKEIKETLAMESGSIWDLFRPGFRLALLIGVGLAILQQVTGINVILYYAPEIFKSVGTAYDQAINDTVWIGLDNFIMTVIALLVVDLFGRKILLLIASAGMGISLTLLGLAFLMQELIAANPDMTLSLFGFTFALQDAGAWNLFLQQLTFVMILAYVAFFAFAMGGVVWVVLSEIFPTQIRGRAMSIAVVILWFSCFMVSQFFPLMHKLMQGSVFFVYAFMCLVAFLFILFLIPETKGKSLEEIERTWIKPS